MEQYYNGEILLRKNEIGNLFYIVLQGQANCYTKSNDSHIQITVLKCGDFFGGKCLFNNLPSVATVEAEDNLKCLTKTRYNFEQELTPAVNMLQQATNQYRVFIETQI